MPASTVTVVHATVPAEVEDDFNKWYNEVHLPEIVGCPGYISGTRYVAETPTGRKYVAIYELESPAALETPELKAHSGWGPFEGQVDASGRVYTQIYQVTADSLKKG
jgi:hypothetical protein